MMGDKKKNIRAYLSYRHNEIQEDELNALVSACKENDIELVYDKKATKEGDSFADFINNDLVGARFVIAFLSPEYFISGYTLHEFIAISKHTSVLGRIRFAPVRASANMVETKITSIKNRILDSSKMQKHIDLCARYQNISRSDGDEKAVRKQICSDVIYGWEQLVAKDLTIIRDAANEVDQDNIAALKKYYTGVADRVVEEYDELLLQQERECKEKVSRNIARKLTGCPELTEKLKSESDYPAITDSEMVDHLLNDLTTVDAINLVANALESLKQVLVLKNDDWILALATAKQICGWLVLRSINPIWWAHNHHQFKYQSVARLPLEGDESELYAEVIISRSVLDAANFKLTAEGTIALNRYKMNSPVFDASEDALTEDVLRPIYKDLHRSEREPHTVSKLIDGIRKIIKARYRRFKRPIYYLMTGDTLDLLEKLNWYQDFIDDLQGQIIFIVIDTKDNSCDEDYCSEGVTDILQAVAEVYRYENI